MANRAKARQLFTKLKKKFQLTKLLPQGKNTRAMPSVDLKHSGTVCWVEETILKDHIRTVKNERGHDWGCRRDLPGPVRVEKRCENLSSRTSGGWR